MKAIILAGGDGESLRPVTCAYPKAMAKIMNKPLMEYIICRLRESGIREIGITLRYKAEEIKNYFGNGSKFGVKIRYFVQDMPLGSGGSAIAVKDFADGDFLVINGNSFCGVDFHKILHFHKEKGGEATIVLQSAGAPSEKGVIITDKNGRIKDFLEKPDWSRVLHNSVDAGVYVLSPSVFKGFEAGSADFMADIFPRILKEGRVLYGIKEEGYPFDISSTDAYRHCHYDIFDRKIVLPTDAEEIEKDVFVRKGALIEEGAILKPYILIGKNTHIKSGAVIESYSTIGDGAVISGGSEVSRSVILDGVHIGERCNIRGAVICESTHISDDAVIFEQSVIGNNAFVGKGVVINPGVKVWPGIRIEEGEIVKSNLLPENTVDKEKAERSLECEKAIREAAESAAEKFGAKIVHTNPFNKEITDSIKSTGKIKGELVLMLDSDANPPLLHSFNLKEDKS